MMLGHGDELLLSPRLLVVVSSMSIFRFSRAEDLPGCFFPVDTGVSD